MPALAGRLRRSGLAIVVPLCVVVTYLPVVVVPYAFEDDYAQLGWVRGYFSTGLLWRHYATDGRPLGGGLVIAAFAATPNLVDLRFVRLAGLLGIALLALLLLRAVIAAGGNRVFAAAVAISVVALPSVQVYAAWGTGFIAPYAAILAGLGSRLALSALDASSRTRTRRLAAASLLLLAALLVYQPGAMCFWLFAAIPALAPRTTLDRAWRVLAAHVVAAIPAAAASFAVLRLFVHVYGAWTPGRANLAGDVAGKLRWFVHQPLVNSLSLFDLMPSTGVAVCVAALAAAGLPLLHYREGRRAFGFVVVAAVLVPLSYLPNLVVRESWASYRSTVALSATLLLYAWLAAWGIVRALPRPAEARRVGRSWGVALVAATSLLALVTLVVVVRPLYHLRAPVPSAWWSSTRWIVAFAMLVALFGAYALNALLAWPVRLRPRAAAALGRSSVLGILIVPLAAALLAARNVTSLFVKPQSTELALLRSDVARAVRDGAKRLAVVRPSPVQGAAPLVAYDEFGLPSTAASWVPGPAVFLILREEKRPGRALDVVDVAPGVSPPAGAYVVDMRRLERLRSGWTVWGLDAAPARGSTAP